MFTRDDLKALITADTQPAVSIYLPTHKAGRETRQDPIRLRNLLGEAEERLRLRGARDADIENVLGPARALLQDNEFWQHQDRGLALFMAPGRFQRHLLPIDVPEEVVVGRRFHVKHLLPLLGAECTWFILAVTAEAARLFEASQDGIAAVDVSDMPRGVGAVVRETDFEESKHAAPTGRPGATAAAGATAMTHGWGDTPEDLRKEQLIEYLRRVDRAVAKALAGEQAPLVLVAQPEIEGNFRSITQLGTALENALQTDPGTIGERELHQRTWDLVRPIFEARQHEAREAFDMLLGRGDARGAVKPDEIVKAARWGRVDTLFLSSGESLWGRFDEASDRVEVRGTPAEEDEDLLDYAAVHTLLQGGNVHFMAERLPRGAPMAAVFRY